MNTPRTTVPGVFLFETAHTSLNDEGLQAPTASETPMAKVSESHEKRSPFFAKGTLPRGRNDGVECVEIMIVGFTCGIPSPRSDDSLRATLVSKHILIV